MTKKELRKIVYSLIANEMGKPVSAPLHCEIKKLFSEYEKIILSQCSAEREPEPFKPIIKKIPRQEIRTWHDMPSQYGDI